MFRPQPLRYRRRKRGGTGRATRFRRRVRSAAAAQIPGGESVPRRRAVGIAFGHVAAVVSIFSRYGRGHGLRVRFAIPRARPRPRFYFATSRSDHAAETTAAAAADIQTTSLAFGLADAFRQRTISRRSRQGRRRRSLVVLRRLRERRRALHFNGLILRSWFRPSFNRLR